MHVANHRYPKPLAETAIELDVPTEAVKDLLLHVAPGQVTAANGWLVGHRFGFDGLSITGGPRRFTVHGGGSSISVDVETEGSMIAMQGGWWYRGEYWIQASGRGTRIIYGVLNIAGNGSRWLVPLANHGFAQLEPETRAHADALARAISDVLEG